MRRVPRIVALVLLAVAWAGLAVPGTALATPPAQPYAWLDVASETSADLRWDAVPGASEYQVSEGARSLGVVTGTSVRVTDLQPGTYHQFVVRARTNPHADATQSIASDPVPVATLAPSGCTHWVATTGSDASGTGTAAAPWRTIGRLVADWHPGDVGCVVGFHREDVTIRTGGTTTAPVVLRAAPGRAATLRGRLWIARGADHVVVAGFRLDGRANHGAQAATLPSPTVNGNYARLIGNDITNAHAHVCAVLGSVRGYGTAVEPVLAYNRVRDCGRRGRNTHHGIYLESTRRAKIVHNAIFDNADRGIQLYPDAQGSLVVGNLLDGNGTGVIFSGAEGWSSSRNLVLRNVVANSKLRSNLEHYWERPSRPGSGNVAARNCLGGAREGDIALPVAGYAARANATGTLRYRARARDDLRLAAGSGCSHLLRSRMLPLAP